MPDQEIFQPQNPEFVRDPYTVYKHLRENDPVHQTAAGMWVISKYDDVMSGLKDVRLSNAPAPFALVNRRNAERHVAAKVANGLIAFMDPPDHLGPRRLIAGACTAFFKQNEQLVQEVSDNLMAQLRDRPQIEFVEDFAMPFATQCICRMMGFPESDVERLKEWSGWFFYLFHAIPNDQVLQEVNRALEEFRAYVQDHVAARRKAPGDDLLSLLIAARRGDESLSEQEIIDNAMLLTADGIENVWAGLATAVYTLLRHPDQLDRVIRDESLVPAAVQECLRFESPGQYQGRIAKETLEIGGKTIKTYSVVLLLLASANRDATVYPDPERFDVGREGPRNVAFGAGRHACIGGMLVEIEFSAAFRTLFRTPGIELKPPAEVEWATRAGHRWPARLPLEIKRV